MSRRDRVTALRQMLDHSREAAELVRGRTRADLDTDRVLDLALQRLLEIVGEAANRVPAEDRDRYPEIPWSEIVALRNRLIHGYDVVDLDILWQIISQDLPALVSRLEALLRMEDQ